MGEINRISIYLSKLLGREGGEGWGRGDYSREAIILSISVIGGDYLREVINRGMAIIRGNTDELSVHDSV